MGGPRQALVGEGGVRGHELGTAVGRQIDARISHPIEADREGQRDGGNRIIPVIANVRGAWHDAAAYLAYGVVAARSRRRRRCRCRSLYGGENVYAAPAIDIVWWPRVAALSGRNKMCRVI